MDHKIINWIQIPSNNLKTAASFYENVFGATFFFERLNDIEHAVFTENSSGKKLLNGAIIEIKKDREIGLGVVLFLIQLENLMKL